MPAEPGAGAARVKSTARLIAYVRATERALPPAERLFDDPFAPVFLSAGQRGSLRLLRSRRVYALAQWARDRRAPGMWGVLLARTRFIDDALSAALASGVEQVVILGAGADSRAFRTPGVEAARVFEVDLPGTQRWKRARLARALPELPAHVRFVPIDFEREALERVLPAAGYRADVPSFFVWEGVTQYLHAPAVDATLRFVHDAAAPGSRLAFTYVDRRVLEGDRRYGDPAPLLARMERTGEPWLFGLRPEELAGFLALRGLRVVEHLGGAELARRTLPASRGLAISGVERVVLAERP